MRNVGQIRIDDMTNSLEVNNAITDSAVALVIVI